LGIFKTKMKPLIYKNRPSLRGKVNFVDAYTSAVSELFFLENPGLKKTTPDGAYKLEKFLKTNQTKESWVYYPDQTTLVRMVNEKDYFKLRTARNRNLITEKEQLLFRNMSVGIAGLSVGSCILSTITISGGPQKIKIADFDTLEITNLNRIRAKLSDVGKNKIHVAAREVWDLDPFAKLILFDKGVNEKNLKNFLLAKPKLDVFIDEMDSLPLKISARFLCKHYKIPVVMATDNGDSVILDIERFDLEPKRKIFHGLLGNATPKLFESLDYKKWLSLATKIVGPEYLTPKMQSSLLEIGKNLPAVPQLGATAGIAGAAICLALRNISNNYPMASGRYVISLEEKLVAGYTNKKNTAFRKKQTKKFIKTFK
jgi:hypothetical protein